MTCTKWKIMPVGDSITEGGKSFSNWRHQLWQKLTTAGYFVEYVGSRKSESPAGPLFHEGYSGKNAEFLATVIGKSFKKHPADIVLIHAGHNHAIDEKPVPGILASTEKIISDVRGVNPKVIVLLALVTPSGKLPKYSYIPDLNKELATLASRLNHPDQPVIIVDHASGFDPAMDTVDDKVHPNEKGADKIAHCWYQAIIKVLPTPDQSYSPKR